MPEHPLARLKLVGNFEVENTHVVILEQRPHEQRRIVFPTIVCGNIIESGDVEITDIIFFPDVSDGKIRSTFDAVPEFPVQCVDVDIVNIIEPGGNEIIIIIILVPKWTRERETSI